MSSHQEIERKYLIAPQERDTLVKRLENSSEGVLYRQAYLALTPRAVVRIRCAGDQGIITIKGKALDKAGLVRPEYEYNIPLLEAEELFHFSEHALIEKTRYTIEYEGHTWEVDIFSGANTGLILAEIELERVDEIFAKPSWIGQEVTRDHRYKNAVLAQKPYQADWE